MVSFEIIRRQYSADAPWLQAVCMTSCLGFELDSGFLGPCDAAEAQRGRRRNSRKNCLSEASFFLGRRRPTGAQGTRRKAGKEVGRPSLLTFLWRDKKVRRREGPQPLGFIDPSSQKAVQPPYPPKSCNSMFSALDEMAISISERTRDRHIAARLVPKTICPAKT